MLYGKVITSVRQNIIISGLSPKSKQIKAKLDQGKAYSYDEAQYETFSIHRSTQVDAMR